LFAVLGVLATVLYFCFHWFHDVSGFAKAKIILFALATVPIFFVVLRMFFMRLPPPTGVPLTRAQAPKLFSVLDKMRKKLKGPPIHHVLVNEEYNAAIMQRPRWGLFGGHTNYLILGLPYLLGVPPQEMLATIAHEYGHLCGNHGKVGAWVYRQRRTFGALYEQVQGKQEDNWMYGGIAKALDKFMPYYQAYTFVLSRQQEYEADATATQLVGAEANASGLIRDALLGGWFYREFWSGMYRQADQKDKPSMLPYTAMRIAFKASYPEWATDESLKSAWKVDSGLNDTHPCMRERVEATGQAMKLPAPVEVNGADALLLPETTRQMIEYFDRTWWNKEQKEWQARHRHVVRSRERMRELSAKPLNALALHDLQEFALLTAEFESHEAAKPVLEHLLKQSGGPYPKAAFFYGRILLGEQNDAGLDHLAAAAKNDRSLAERVAHLGYDYQYRKRGETAAQAWWEKIAESAAEAA